MKSKELDIVDDLSKIIPSWQKVSLTKEGYVNQYLQTLLAVAIYVLEREKKAIEGLNEK